MRRERAASAGRALLDLLQHTQQLAHAADQQALLVDLDPRPGRSGEDNVIAGLDRHVHAHVIPPVEARADREHDPVLRWRFVRAWRHEQSGSPHTVGIQLLDHYAIEERT